MTHDKLLAEQLRELELSLINSNVSSSINPATLMADSFIEFGSSGRVYNKSQALDSMHANTLDTVISQFDLKQLSPDLALVTYRARQDRTPPVATLRSSLWHKTADGWKILFHQGTQITISG